MRRILIGAIPAALLFAAGAICGASAVKCCTEYKGGKCIRWDVCSAK